MATTITKTDKQVRFVEGTEAAYKADTASFANDCYLCTDSGRLYMRGVEVTDVTTKAALTAHLSDKANPHGVTKAQVGLGNVDNTADKDKTISIGRIKWGDTTEQSTGVIPPLYGIFSGVLQNKFAFMPRKYITIEYSNDDGETWTDMTSSVSDEILGLLFTPKGYSKLYIGNNKTGTNHFSDHLRITVLCDNWVNLYTTPRAVMVQMAGCGSDIYMDVMGRSDNDIADGKDFSTIATARVNGDSHWNRVDLGDVKVWGGQYKWAMRYVRFQFRYIDGGSNYTFSAVPGVRSILCLGDTNWATPSNMAKTGHLYDYDYLQNALFPAGVYTNKNVQVVDTAGTGLSKSGSTLNVVPKSVLDAIGTATDTPSDDSYYVATGQTASDGNYYRRKLSTLYTYLNSKLPDASASARGLMTAEQVTELSDLKTQVDGTIVPALDNIPASIEAGQSMTAMTLQLKGASLLGSATTLPAATGDNAGVMSAAQVTQQEANTSDISSLKGMVGTMGDTVSGHTTSITTLQSSVSTLQNNADIVLDFGSTQTPSDPSAAYMAMMTAAQDGKEVRIKFSANGMAITITLVCLTYDGTSVVKGYFFFGPTGHMRVITLTNSSGSVTVEWAEADTN